MSKNLNSSLYRDSISRCDDYSNPYDAKMASNPAMVRHRAQEYARAKDVLETTQKKIERDLLQRLMLRLPQGNYILLAQLGRFAFLALILPPYMLLYSMPKWLLFAAMPQFFLFMRKTGRALHSALMKPIKNGWNKITAPISAFAERVKNGFNQTLQAIKDAYQKVYDLVTFPGRWIASNVYQPMLDRFNSIGKFMSQTGQLGREFLKNIFGQMKKLGLGPFKWAGELASQAANLLNLPKTLLGKLPHMQNPFSGAGIWMASNMEKLRGYYSDIFKRSASLMRGFGDKVRSRTHDAFSNVQNYLHRLYEGMKNQASKWTDPFINFARELFDKRPGWDEVASKFRREGVISALKQAAREAASATKKGLKSVAKAAVAFSMDLAQLMPAPVITLFFPMIALTKAIVRTSSKVYHNRKHIYERFKKAKDAFARGFRGAYSGVKQIVRLLRWAYTTYKPYVVEFMQWVASLIARLVMVCIEVLKRLGFLLRLLLAWIRVLFQYGMIQVRDTAQKLSLLINMKS